MAINFPENRKSISDRIKSDVKGQLPESNPYLRNSFLQAVIFGLAGRLFDIYKLAKTLLNNLFWDTALGEFLERPAAFFGITRNSASNASGSITIPGTPTTLIISGTEFQNSSGLTYASDSNSTIQSNTTAISTITQSAGVATVTTGTNHLLAPNIEVVISGAVETEYNGTFVVTSVLSEAIFQMTVDPGASSPASGTIEADYDTASVDITATGTTLENSGDQTNADEGDSFTLKNPIAGVDDTGYAQFEGLSGGSNEEDDEDLRDRFLFRVQNPVALFNSAAIETEAKKVTGVTRVFVNNVDTTQGSITATTLTRSGSVGTFEASGNHNLTDGQKVTISGAVETGYNVTDRKIIVINSTDFAYVVDGTPTTPATGTPLAEASIVEEGQVKVFFTRDNDEEIIPSAQEVTDVKDQILTIKPAFMSDSDVIVAAPIAIETDFIFSTITPNTNTMQEALTQNLSAFYQEQTDIGQDVLKTEYDAAIANTVDPATGERIRSFTLTAPTGNISVGQNELGILGDVTF